MIKTKRRPKRKSLLSWILILTFLLTSIPMDSFADSRTVVINEIKFNQIRKGENVNSSGFAIIGENLSEESIKNISITKDTSLPKSIRGMNVNIYPEYDSYTVLTKEDTPKEFNELNFSRDGSTTITVSLNDGYTFDGSKTTKSFKINLKLPSITGISHTTVPKLTYLPDYLKHEPETDPPIQQGLLIKGANFKDSDVLKIASGTADKIVKDSGKTYEVISIDGSADINENNIEISKTQTIDSIDVTYTVNFVEAIQVVNLLGGFEKVEVRPKIGSLNKINKFNVVSLDTNGDYKTIDKNIIIELRNSETKELMPQVKSELTSDSKQLIVTTPSVQGDKRQEYDVIIKDEGNKASKIIENGYILQSGLTTLGITEVVDDKANSTQYGSEDTWKPILIKGKNMITFNEDYYGIENGQGIKPKTALTDGNIYQESETNKYTGIPGLKGIKIEYELQPNEQNLKPQYNGKEITKIERIISVEIGGYLQPKKMDEISLGTSTNHYYSDSQDGIFFLPFKDVEPGQYSVVLDSRTYITYNGLSKPIEIPDTDTWEKKFTFIEYPLIPIINNLTPNYGYFYDGPIETGSDDKTAPLMLRLTGDKFKLIQKTVAGNTVTEYPTVEFYDNSLQTPIPVLGIKVIPKKILNVINGQESSVPIIGGQAVGNTLVIEIDAVGENVLREIIRKYPADTTKGYHDLPLKIIIKNPDEGQKESVVNFKFRHPNTIDETELALIQPRIIGIYRADYIGDNPTPEYVFNSNIDNEILVKFKNGGSASDVVVTIDGKIIDKLPYSEPVEDDGTNVIKLKLPKGITGETRLQIISTKGLMHSKDITFTSSDGPWLKSLTPTEGQAGTWVTIKRDKDINSTSVFKEGAQVIIDNTLLTQDVYYIDANTIEFKIPDNTSYNPSLKNIVVQNPGETVKSNPLQFRVINITENQKIQIESIEPNIGNLKGGIPVVIKSKSGFKFDKAEMPYKVYFGDQLSKDVKVSLDGTALYVIVPQADKAKSVPVTVQNKSGATDTIRNGFTYYNQAYDMDITKLVKLDNNGNEIDTNEGLVGERFLIKGSNFRVKPTIGSDVISQDSLPYVFFGYERAVVVGPTKLSKPATSDAPIDINTLEVIIPKKSENATAKGSVDVMVVNKADGGTITKKDFFVYGTMNPEIISSGLRASSFGETIQVKTKDVYKENLIVAFGDDSKEENSKPLDSNNKANVDIVSEIGDILIKYEYKSSGPTAKIYYKNGTEEILMKDAKGEGVVAGEFRLDEFTTEKLVGINWKNKDYHQNPSIKDRPDLLQRLNDEYVLVKLDVKNDKLIVRRSIGEIESVNKSGDTYIIKTPFHYFNPKSWIKFINANGSETKPVPFEFHSGLDFPEITDIKGSKEVNEKIDGVDTKVKVYTHDVTADATIELIGKNFKDVNKVSVGDKEVTFKINDNNYTSLVLNVPKGESSDVGKLQNVIVETKEGIALSQKSVPPVFFKYIFTGSKPVIETIEPTMGPRTGSTKVRITGKDFRELDEYGTGSTGEAKKTLIKVSINGTPSVIDSLEYDDKKELIGLTIFTPQSVTGKAKLQVINADGGTSEPKDFTYISQPKISQTEGSIFFNDTTTEVRLFGEDFQSGAKVVIGADQTKGKKPADASVSGMIGVTADGQNQEGHLVGGVEAADVKVTGTNQITFKMPDGIESLENTSIIIVNPDTGMSEPGQGNIKPPVPDVPDIEAIPGFERTMILRWTVDKDVLNAAEKFEIYVRERRSGDYTFVGDTKQDTTEQSYVIKGLKYDTTYDILVRVLNKYGEAEDFGSVRETTLKQNQDYKEKEKVEAVDKAVTQIETQGKQEVIGDTLYYTVGTRESTINLSNTTAKNKTKYVQIPVKDIKAGNKTITITDKDLSLTVSYSSLNTLELRNAPDDAVFRFKISAAEKQVEEGLTRAIPRVYKKASNVYGIYFELAQPKLVTPIAMLSGSATININAPAYPKYHAVYIESADTFSILQSNIITQGGNYVLLTNK